MQTFPDLAHSFGKFILQDEIGKCLHTGLFPTICRENVYIDYNGVIKMMQDQIRDNAPLMAEMFGPFILLKLDDLHGSSLTSYERWQLSKYGNILAERKDVGEWNGPVPDYRVDEREAREQNFEL